MGKGFHLGVIWECYDWTGSIAVDLRGNVMPRDQFGLPSSPGRTFRKLLLSTFVVIAFAAYAAIERLTRTTGVAEAASTPSADSPVAGQSSARQAAPQAQPTQAPASNAVPAASGYKDGTYQGQPVDAYYGLVQVQVSIQGGAISSVQFLQYPNDRRTSQQINSIAMPWLQQEAVQAQSANVNIISGATLTSEGFQMSLQTALQAAHN